MTYGYSGIGTDWNRVAVEDYGLTAPGYGFITRETGRGIPQQAPQYVPTQLPKSDSFAPTPKKNNNKLILGMGAIAAATILGLAALKRGTFGKLTNIFKKSAAKATTSVPNSTVESIVTKQNEFKCGADNVASLLKQTAENIKKDIEKIKDDLFQELKNVKDTPIKQPEFKCGADNVSSQFKQIAENLKKDIEKTINNLKKQTKKQTNAKGATKTGSNHKKAAQVHPKNKKVKNAQKAKAKTPKTPVKTTKQQIQNTSIKEVSAQKVTKNPPIENKVAAKTDLTGPTANVDTKALPTPEAQKALPGPTANIEAQKALPGPTANIDTKALPTPEAQKALPGPTANVDTKALPAPEAQKALTGPTAKTANIPFSFISSGLTPKELNVVKLMQEEAQRQQKALATTAKVELANTQAAKKAKRVTPWANKSKRNNDFLGEVIKGLIEKDPKTKEYLSRNGVNIKFRKDISEAGLISKLRRYIKESIKANRTTPGIGPDIKILLKNTYKVPNIVE